MKLRVLCLHGYTQTGQKFRDRLGPFRRGLKNQLDLVFMTAPHMATNVFSNSEEPQEKEGESMAWWNQSDDAEKVEKEIMQSVQEIENTLVREGPFHGIMGFSQGAGMAAIMAALAERNKVNVGSFGFALFFAGFYPGQLRMFDEMVREAKVKVPSLHVVGDNDLVVSSERGVELATRAFDGAQVKRHPGGHFVPCNAEWRKIYQAFLAGLEESAA
ncbi:Ovarian cancer-associated protein 2 [Coemansia sp. RSA 486]|nr:Ovarian cancer-associated protein 2 [Coemansia sp. RSA 486]KAJ2596648.1 Ovarian cancer-associated protein 2 [Coemansia sp. RSA 1721]